MGQAPEEKFRDLTYATQWLTNTAKELKNPKDVYLRQLLEKLWPALLQGLRRPTHWMLGTSCHGNEVGEGSLLGIALLHHKPVEKDPDDPLQKRYYQDFAKERLSIVNLLRDKDDTLSKVYEVFEIAESVAGSLHRKEEDFKNALDAYDELICRIQGECFNYFTQEKLLTQAWLQNRILSKLLTWQDDIIQKWWETENMHHDFRLLEFPFALTLERLIEIYGEIQFENPSINQRIQISIELACPRWHYKHQHEKAIKLFQEHNKTANKADKIDLVAVRKGAAKCMEMHEARQEKGMEEYLTRKYCKLTGKTHDGKVEKPTTPKPKKQAKPKKAAPKPRATKKKREPQPI